MIELNIVPFLAVVIAGYVLLMRILTKQVSKLAEENIDLRTKNSGLQDDLSTARNLNNELEIELKKKVSDLTKLVNTLQEKVEKLSKESEGKDALIDFFQKQADVNNQLVIEERERRVIAETKLDQANIKITELKAQLKE